MATGSFGLIASSRIGEASPESPSSTFGELEAAESRINGKVLEQEPEHRQPADSNGFHVEAHDPVVWTASDRPEAVTLPALADPAVGHGDDDLAKRRADVEDKHQKVVSFLEANGYDALVLGRADSISWFTSGGEVGLDLGSDAGCVLLFINKGGRAVFSDNVHSARVFEEEFAGLGFQLKERPWNEGTEKIVSELSGSRKIATDTGLLGLPNEFDRLKKLRLSLTKIERQRLRELGWTLSAAVEATCLNFLPGETEADLAGHLSHRLFREGVVPITISIAGDDRLERYRRPGFKAARIENRAVITATGRRAGLCATVTRIVSFGKPPAAFRSSHALASMVDATLIYFSRPGEAVCEVFRRAKRIFEKFGHSHEWTLDYPGGLVGYSPREFPFLHESEETLQSQVAVAWAPSVGPARSGDTVLVNERGFEVVTAPQRWPRLEVLVKGYAIERPGILER